MEKTERKKWESRLKNLNQRFLAEIESGAGWNDVKDIMEEMKEIAKGLNNSIATVVSFDKYPLENNLGELG